MSASSQRRRRVFFQHFFSSDAVHYSIQPFMSDGDALHLMIINKASAQCYCRRPYPLKRLFTAKQLVRPRHSDSLIICAAVLSDFDLTAKDVATATLAGLSVLRLSINSHFSWNILSPMHLLTELTVDAKFDWSPLRIDGTLPTSLTALTFGGHFNRPIQAFVLPSKLKRLVLSEKFNQTIVAGSLPPSLTELSFGQEAQQGGASHVAANGEFNQILVEGALPPSLQTLRLGIAFNQMLAANVLPSSLRRLIFSVNYNQPIHVATLPASITDLTFGSRFCQSILPGSDRTMANGTVLAHFTAMDTALNQPCGLAVDRFGVVFVCDARNDRIARFATDGRQLASYRAGNPSLRRPQALALDGAGFLYIADTGNHRVVKLWANSGILASVFTTADPELAYPTGICVDADGNIFVADCNNFRVVKLSPEGHLLQSFSPTYAQHDVDLSAVKLTKVAVDHDGFLYVIGWNTAIFKLDGNGTQVGLLEMYRANDITVAQNTVFVSKPTSGSAESIVAIKFDGDDNTIVQTIRTALTLTVCGIVADALAHVYVSSLNPNGVFKIAARYGGETANERKIDDGVPVLPSALVRLKFGDDFDQPVGIGSLPDGLISLTFGKSFNHAIEAAALPQSLESLTLGDRYNHPILADTLPSHLTHLKFGAEFAQTIVDNVLPQSLTMLHLSRGFQQPLSQQLLPFALKRLTVIGPFNAKLVAETLPTSLTALTLNTYFNRPILPHTLPRSLRTLRLGGRFDQPLSTVCFPPDLRRLELEGEFNQELVKGDLPQSITHLSLCVHAYSHYLSAAVLPRNLLFLQLPPFYKRTIRHSHMFPSSITQLMIAQQNPSQLPNGKYSILYYDATYDWKLSSSRCFCCR